MFVYRGYNKYVPCILITKMVYNWNQQVFLGKQCMGMSYFIFIVFQQLLYCQCFKIKRISYEGIKNTFSKLDNLLVAACPLVNPDKLQIIFKGHCQYL